MAKNKTKLAEEKVHAEEKIHKELEQVKGMLARTLADYDNLGKRVDRERADLGKIASIGIIARLLPILDNLESAQVHLKDQGLAISILEFKKVLDEVGFSEIKPSIGEIFDENLMEAIEVVPGVSNNTIAEVILVGWKYEDGSVVRHAKVKVNKK